MTYAWRLWKGLARCGLPLLLGLAMAMAMAMAHPLRSLQEEARPAESAFLRDLEPLPDLDLTDLEEAVARQLDEMEKLLQAALSQTPEAEGPAEPLGQAFGELAQHYHTYGFSEAAEIAYRNAIRLLPEEFRWRYYLGYLYQGGGRLTAARDAYSLALARRPDSVPTMVHLAEVYFAQNRPEGAEPLLHRALVLDPASAPAMALLGEMALSQRRYEAAAEHLLAALRAVPDANRLHYPLAMAYRGLGKIDEARHHLGRRGIVGVRPRDPLLDELNELKRGERVHLIRGKLAYNAGRFSEAVEEYRQAVAAQPESAGARVNLGSALAQLGDTGGAIEELRQALKLVPGNPTAHFNLGSLLASRGSIVEALEHLQTAVRLNPNDFQAHFELARVLERSGRAEPAIEHYRKVVGFNPSVAQAWLGEVRLLLAQDHDKEAAERLETAHAIEPRDITIAHALSRLLVRARQAELRDGDRALDLALRVFDIDKSVTNAETVAMALAEVGRCEEAAQWQRDAVQAVVQAGQLERAELLKRGLERYASGEPCGFPLTP